MLSDFGLSSEPLSLCPGLPVFSLPPPGHRLQGARAIFLQGTLFMLIIPFLKSVHGSHRIKSILISLTFKVPANLSSFISYPPLSMIPSAPTTSNLLHSSNTPSFPSPAPHLCPSWFLCLEPPSSYLPAAFLSPPFQAQLLFSITHTHFGQD